MSGPHQMFTQFRLGTMSFFALRTPLTGCGFALAFGWLWFPSLREVLLSCLSGMPIFHPSAFSFALGAGCFFYGLLCRRLENSNARHRFLNVILAHGVSPLLLGLLLLVRSMGQSFAILDGTLMGLAGALPGVWWTFRLLESGPGKAVVSLAWAAFLSLILALPLSRIQTDCTVSVCVLSASFALAWLVALFLIREENEGCGAEDARPDTATSLEAPYSFGPFRGIYAVLLCGIAPIFFCLGSLNVLVHGTDTVVQAIAQLCALIVAVFILDGPVERTLGIAACVLAVLTFCLLPSPELAPILYPVGEGLLEAAGVAICAAFLRREAFGQGATEFVAGLFLAVTLAAVNGGQLVGWELASFTDKAWPVLPGLVAALLLAAAAYQGRKPMTETEVALYETKQELLFALLTSDRIKPTATTNSRAIIEPLTKREQTVASLLANGYSNKDAAENLGLSANALRWHIKNLHKKTGTANRTELVTLLKETSAIRG